MSYLVSVQREETRMGRVRTVTKWVRPANVKPPSQANSHRRLYFQKTRIKALHLLGDRCLACGYTDIRALQIDHIYADNEEDKRHSGIAYYNNLIKQIRATPERYQVLCANCNVIKRLENRECPRKVEGEC